MNTRMSSSQKNTTRLAAHSPVSPVSDSVPNRHREQLSEERQATSNSVEALQFAHLSQPEQDILLRQQALANARRGKYAEAIVLFNLLIKLNPKNASNYNNRGLLHFQNGQLELALADYNRALKLNPRLAKVYNNRANCYAALGKLEDAIADYETAIDLNPANLHAWINQGITFRDLKLYEQAIENFEIALQFSQLMHSADAETTTALEGHIFAERGRTYHLSGDWNCAVADYHRALAVLPAAGSSGSKGSQRLRVQVETWMESLLGPLSF